MNKLAVIGLIAFGGLSIAALIAVLTLLPAWLLMWGVNFLHTGFPVVPHVSFWQSFAIVTILNVLSYPLRSKK